MYKKFIKLLGSRTAKDASIMTFSTAVSASLAAVMFIIVARLLGPENLGIFSLATAASFMFADIFDVALNSSIVRFVSRERSKKEGKSDQYLKFAFQIKLVVAIVVAIVLIIFSKPLSKVLFGKTLPVLVILTAFGTAFQMLYTFTISHFQARSEFKKAGIGVITLPGVRLLGIITLVLTGFLKTISALLIYFFSTPFIFLAVFLKSPTSFLHASINSETAKRFLKYNIPLTLGLALASLGGRIDNFILVNKVDATAVGYYAAAFRLFTPLQYFAGTISTVFAPRFASFNTNKKALVYLKKSLLGIIFLSGGVLLFIPLSSLIIGLFYGSTYQPSVPILKILFFGFAALLAQAPFTSAVLYYFAKTKLFTIISFIQLVTLISLDLFLIPRYQGIGAAYAFVITQIIIFLILSVYSFVNIRKK